MAETTPKTKTAARDNLGRNGTDDAPSYQDKAGLTGADADPKTELNHGEESPAAKAERESAEKNGLASLGLPAQMLPENQDETVQG